MSARMRTPFTFLALASFVLASCESQSKQALQSDVVSVPGPTAAAAPAMDATSSSDAPVAAAFSARRAGAIAGVSKSTEALRLSAPTTQAPASQQEITPGSMLVRTGQASLQVDSLEVGIARVRDVARRTGAIIANTSMAGGREQTRSASLELRIPSERFDEAVNGLSPIGKLESVSVSVQDVGEEYVDVAARVANARRLEQRLVELLANRTGKLSDVLTVERELARVREEIERYEGRMRYLRSRASVSTLSIAVHEPFPIVAERPGTHPIRDAFIQAWRNLIGVTAGLIASLGVIIPLGLVAAAIVLVVRRWVPTRSWGLTPKA
jgi:acetolactate synthase regulatory subunit